MSESFDSFNAPQFVDFCKGAASEEVCNPDEYFEIDHEKVQTIHKIIQYEDQDDVFYSPTYNNTPAVKSNNHVHVDQLISFSDESYEEETTVTQRRRLRRSISVGNLDLQSLYEVTNGLEELSSNVRCANSKTKINGSQKTFGNIPKAAVCKKVESKPLCKPKSGSLKNIHKVISKSNLTLNSTGSSHVGSIRKPPSIEHLNKLAQPKYRSNECMNRYHQPLAELVLEYQNKTPVRFHSQQKLNLVDAVPYHGKITVPHSPALQAKNRLRPVHYPTHEEREQAEFQEAQRFKIKAHPIKKKVLSGPIKPVQPIEKKPLTVPEPFNLTKPKKVPPRREDSYEFHAQPIPKSVLEPPKLKEFPKQITKPETPKFMKRYARDMQKVQQDDKENVERKDSKEAPSRTVLEPFSFEARDKQLQKKKEMFIQKILEEEKKAREFHARPMPKTLFQSPGKGAHPENRRNSGSSGGSSKLAKSDDNISMITQFRARPATVLYKEPFVPKKEERPLVEITSFYLNTELRAKEREEYERYLKEKEEKVMMLRRQQEEEQQRLEEEERAKLRKETEVKAQPIRKYKELHIQPANKVTEPITPIFHTDRLRKHHKESLE